MTWLHASSLVSTDGQHVLLEHHLEHSNRLLALFEAVAKAVKLDHISHRPCLLLDKGFRVGYKVLSCRKLLLCFFIEADPLGYRFSPLFVWVTLLCHACLNAWLEFHTLNKTFLECHACLLEFDRGSLGGLLRRLRQRISLFSLRRILGH